MIKLGIESKFDDGQSFEYEGKTYDVLACVAASRDLIIFEMCIASHAMHYGPMCGDTMRSFLEHMKQVQEADLSYPIILNEDGAIIDGRHRFCKAILEGHKTIKAVRFDLDPVGIYTYTDNN